MKLLLALLFTCSAAMAAHPDDKLIDTSTRTEYTSCTKRCSYRNCSGSWKRRTCRTSYRSCSGRKSRTVYTKTYISSKTKKEYKEISYGSYGGCH